MEDGQLKKIIREKIVNDRIVVLFYSFFFIAIFDLYTQKISKVADELIQASGIFRYVLYPIFGALFLYVYTFGTIAFSCWYSWLKRTRICLANVIVGVSFLLGQIAPFSQNQWIASDLLLAAQLFVNGLLIRESIAFNWIAIIPLAIAFILQSKILFVFANTSIAVYFFSFVFLILTKKWKIDLTEYPL